MKKKIVVGGFTEEEVKENKKRSTKDSISPIPLGATCHYERVEGKWYVVWGADFLQDDTGRVECNDHDSMMLEMGYYVGKSGKR